MRKSLVCILVLLVSQFSLINSRTNNKLEHYYIPVQASGQEILGTDFTASEDAHILKIRVNFILGDTSDHSVRIWTKNNNNYTLIYGPYLWALPKEVTGWQEFEFPVPLPVVKNTTYFISIGPVPTLPSASDNTRNQSNVSEKVSDAQVYAQNAGATLSTSWFTANPKRVELILSVKFKACTIGSDQKICSNSKPETLVQIEPPAGGTGTYTFQWQSSTDSKVWIDIAGARNSSYTPPALTLNTWYRCTVTSGASGMLNSNPVLMTVMDPLVPGSIGNSQTICYNTAPSQVTAKSDPTGGEGIYQYVWQSSTDDLNWTNIAGATDKVYQPDKLTITTWIRRGVTSGNCDKKISNEVKITVIPSLDPGTIGSAQSICNNSTPAGLTNIKSPSGGTGTYEYQWQNSTDNSVWNNIAGANRITYNPPALTVSTWYRRLIVNDSCNLKSSNSVLIDVNTALSAGTVGPAQQICYNSVPQELSHSAQPSGGAGSYVFQWQSSTNNSTWVNIPGATSANYLPASLTATTWFRCNVTSGNCGTATGNAVQILVYAALSAGTAGNSQSICLNETPAAITLVTAPSGADGSFTFQWQNSADNNSWTDISGSVSQRYAPPALTSSTWYRCTVTSSKCGSTSTNSVAVTVNPALTAGSVGSDQSICYNSAPAGLTQISAPAGGTGIYSFQWQSSADNASWSNIANATQATYSPGALTTGTWFRRVVGSGDCQTLAGNSVHIDVGAVINPGSVGSAQNICYGTTPAPLTQITAPTGGSGTYAFQWQSSADNSTWTNISGAISSSYTPPSLTSSGWYRRNVTSGTCAPVSSASIGITVYAILSPGTIGSDQSICSNSAPATLAQITSPSGGTGSYTYQWQSSSDNSTWANISGATSSSYSPPALTSSTWYRRTVTGGSCGNANTNSVHITVYPALTAGTIGSNQTICYNTLPATLNQITAPSGGTGSYSFLWQRSADNSTWSDIPAATSASYSPSQQTSNFWFRRSVTSDGCSGYSNSVLITVLSELSQAQLHDSKKILPGTSTTISVTISGGSSPYTVTYAQNGVAQGTLLNYTSGSAISTGVLSEGTYVYTLTSVTDANGCSAQDLGEGIAIIATSIQASDNALVLVNSGSSYYSDFTTYVQPYLDNFGVPYEVCNVNTTALPDLTRYALIIFGHRNVYSSGYPISALEPAIYSGTGLYSFDPHLFDYSSAFNNLISQVSVNSSQINIPNYSHFITQLHAPDTYNSSNNVVGLRSSWSITQNSNLVNATNLATMTSGSTTVNLLQASSYGSGRVVKWCGYDWMFESILGPIYGMDDLIWRGIVWAARKPFAIQGLPNFLTMRVDDSQAHGGLSANNFDWIKVSNEFGIIPWAGIFVDEVPSTCIPILKSLEDNNLATSSPHAFGAEFIYFNHNNLPSFDPVANTNRAWNFYTTNGLKISKYFIPHFYEVSYAALPVIKSMGGDFIGIHMLPDQLYFGDPAEPWINCGPYRINRNGYAEPGNIPVYYGDYVNLGGLEFFNCITEIRDDGGYEWYPDSDITSTVARGIRHLRRAMGSLVLASLFTHEYYFDNISTTDLREILRQITTAISGYNPEYTSMDYAITYVRAKKNLKITETSDASGSFIITYIGNNDLDTRCYLYTEQNGNITYKTVTLPMVNGSRTVTVSY